MRIKHTHILTNLVTAFAVTLFFLSCTGKGDAVKQLQVRMDGPVSEGTGINMKYTDSGRVTAHLKTPLRLDFSNETFAYEEYPDGVDLTFYDEEGKESHLTAKYAIRYAETSLIDLRNNVVLVTSDSATLSAQQLYWDQDSHWVFTDKPYVLVTKDGSRNAGDLFDSNEDFTNFVSLNNIGKQYIKEEATNDTLQ